jgi:hypothetical protein
MMMVVLVMMIDDEAVCNSSPDAAFSGCNV